MNRINLILYSFFYTISNQIVLPVKHQREVDTLSQILSFNIGEFGGGKLSIVSHHLIWKSYLVTSRGDI